MNAHEINNLFERESPVGQLYVRLKELGIQVDREWWIDDEGTTYVVDLALPVEDGWLPVPFSFVKNMCVCLRITAHHQVGIFC